MFLWCSFDFSLPRWAAHFPPADMRTVLSISNLASWLEVQYGQHHKNDDKEQKPWQNSNMKPCKQTYGTNSSRAALDKTGWANRSGWHKSPLSPRPVFQMAKGER